MTNGTHDTQALVGHQVQAQAQGWKDAQRARRPRPAFDGLPLHVHGVLASGGPDGPFTVDGVAVDAGTVRPAPAATGVAWDDVTLADLADLRYPWRAELRRLQSWYRQEVLGLDPGISHSPRGRRPVGSWLPEQAVEHDPSLNFLADERVLRLVRQRCATRGWGGVVERRRLFHNLLSSQPLCFNLFGPLLFEHPDVLTGVLRDAYGLGAKRVIDVRIDWAARPGHSNFNCFVEYETLHGRGFLAIDTKYAEDLRDQKVSANSAFRAETETFGSGFLPGAADRLPGRPASVGLWYQLLLAKSLQRHHGYDEAVVALTSCAGDTLARAAVDGLASELEQPSLSLRHATYEDVVAAGLFRAPQLSGWASHFTRRYLDLTPVARPQLFRTTQAAAG